MVGGVSIGNDWHIVPLRGALGPSQKRLLIFPFVENDDDLSANIWLHRPPMTLHRSVRSHFSTPPLSPLPSISPCCATTCTRRFRFFFWELNYGKSNEIEFIIELFNWILKRLKFCNTIFVLFKEIFKFKSFIIFCKIDYNLYRFIINLLYFKLQIYIVSSFLGQSFIQFLIVAAVWMEK